MWQFSLFYGTNRLKTLNEVQAGDKVISGVVLLKQHLALLAEGEQVFWSNARFPELLFLPAEIVEDISWFAETRAVKIRLSQ